MKSQIFNYEIFNFECYRKLSSFHPPQYFHMLCAKYELKPLCVTNCTDKTNFFKNLQIIRVIVIAKVYHSPLVTMEIVLP